MFSYDAYSHMFSFHILPLAFTVTSSPATTLDKVDRKSISLSTATIDHDDYYKRIEGLFHFHTRKTEGFDCDGICQN